MKDRIICYFLVFFGACIGGGIALLLLISWLTPPLNLIGQPYTTAMAATDMKVDQAGAVVELIKLGVIIPLDVALQQIVNFYSTIINFLVSLMVLISVIAYMYIKAKSNEQAEEVAHKSVQNTTNIYFESESYHQKIRAIAKEHVDSVSQELEKNIAMSVGDVVDEFARIKDCPEELKKLQKQIDVIAEQLAHQASESES